MYVPSTYTPFAPWKFLKSLLKSKSFSNIVDFKWSKTSYVHTASIAVINPPEKKLAKRTSVRCANSLPQLLRVIFAILYKAITLPVNEL